MRRRSRLAADPPRPDRLAHSAWGHSLLISINLLAVAPSTWWLSVGAYPLIICYVCASVVMISGLAPVCMVVCLFALAGQFCTHCFFGFQGIQTQRCAPVSDWRLLSCTIVTCLCMAAAFSRSCVVCGLALDSRYHGASLDLLSYLAPWLLPSSMLCCAPAL